MPTQAKPLNLLYTWQYRIEVDGLEAALARSVQRPEMTAESYDHFEGGANIGISLPTGRLTIGELVIEKLRPGYDADSWVWDWLITAVDYPVEDALKTVSLLELDKDGGVINRWDWEDCWCCKSSESKKDASQKNEPVVETVTLKVGKPVRV